MTARIMIVDDEQAIRESLQGLFEDESYLVVCAASGEEAIARLRKQAVDCILLDIWMPGIDGLETLSRIHLMDATMPVIMMSGHATIDTAVRATRQGAFDFVEKPLSADRLLVLARNAVQKRHLAQENADLKRQEQGNQSRQQLIGISAAITGIKSLIQRAAMSDSPVLILGEHGTGKDIAARSLHASSRRKDGLFVEVNTASVPANHMDSELFGHEKGAFAGALHAQRGRFEMAHQGTLFLDEVTELSLSAQARILRVLQQREVQRLGSQSTLPCDTRLIAASTRDPEQALRQEHLREDFYYRLNVVTIRMPALRDRIEDLPLLIEAIADEQRQDLGGQSIHFSTPALAQLQAYKWPGNVRELRNYLERCHILMAGEEITETTMLSPGQSLAQPSDPSASSTTTTATIINDLASDSFHDARDNFERQFLLQYLDRHAWNISRTAADIGMERSQLHRKIKAFGLLPPEEGSV